MIFVLRKLSVTKEGFPDNILRLHLNTIYKRALKESYHYIYFKTFKEFQNNKDTVLYF